MDYEDFNMDIEKVENGFIVDRGWNAGRRIKIVFLTWTEVVEYVAANELKGEKVAESVTPTS